MWITISKEAAAVPLIAAADVGRGRCELIFWGFSYRRVSMKAKPAAGCPRGVRCLRLSMLTDIAKPDLRLFGSCALCDFTGVNG